MFFLFGPNHIQMGRVGIYGKVVQKITETLSRTSSSNTVTRLMSVLTTGPQLGCLFDNAEESTSPTKP